MRLCNLLLLLVVTHSKRIVIEPSGYNTLGWFDDSTIATKTKPFEIIVRLHENKNGLEHVQQVAKAVSDPLHPKYGDYLTRDQINTMTAPSSKHTEELKLWIHKTDGKCILNKETTIIYKVKCNDISAAEKLLQTSSSRS